MSKAAYFPSNVRLYLNHCIKSRGKENYRLHKPQFVIEICSTYSTLYYTFLTDNFINWYLGLRENHNDWEK